MTQDELRAKARELAPAGCAMSAAVLRLFALLKWHERGADAVIALTGQVTHATDAECVGCGCRSLTPAEAVAGVLRAKDELILRQCDRIEVQAQCLARAAAKKEPQP